MENDLYIDSLYKIEHKNHSEDSLKSIDSFLIIKENDTTILIETKEKEKKLIHKYIDRPDFGKNVLIILIIIFVGISIIKRRKNG
jgi:hypothetical protein